MELRKDPITRSWVIVGDDVPEQPPRADFCRFCQDSPVAPQPVSTRPSVDGGPWVELVSGRDCYRQKESCVLSNIHSQELSQELRVLEARGDFIALCHYAPRVPYETWIIPSTHGAAFESFALVRPGTLGDLAALLRRTLQRIRTITEEFHLVLHTSPNTLHASESLDYWKTIDEDYHWHIEILPIISAKARSYTFKEVYYSPLTSETAVRRLRDTKVESVIA